MGHQSTVPLRQLFAGRTRPWDAAECARLVRSDEIDIRPHLIRGTRWSEGMQIELIRSLLLGVPVGMVILNDRFNSGWESAIENSSYGVVDGVQRLDAVTAWFTSQLSVPASWFPTARYAQSHETSDGAYVRYSDLKTRGLPFAPIPVLTVHLISRADEIALHDLVSGTGQAPDRPIEEVTPHIFGQRG